MGYLAEASQQLLERENCLFKLQSTNEDVICTEDEKECLKKDYETLMDHLKFAVHDSFNLENQEMLRSAIMAIVQQEERDKLWEEAAEESPCWRPMRCREIHNTIIKEVVEERLQQANEEESDMDILKRDVIKMCDIQKDLLQVVNHVQKCYTDFNVVHMYAQLYHQAFSEKLRKLLQCSVTIDDYKSILQQTNGFSKQILQHDELNQHIKIESLGALLPEEEHMSLEEQYLSHKEKEVETWLTNALKLKKTDWDANKKPELLDEYYFCNLYLDVIGVWASGYVGSFYCLSDVH
ncbi:tumor necrosis factor alpha-induced protein 2 [Silurus meridionalis]|nr:tumor necrosis factor alpha-induced protein 2 [Silurus meridionalis]